MGLKILLFSLFLLASPAQATPPHLLDLSPLVEGLWIMPDLFIEKGKPRFINVRVLPAEDSTQALLEIKLDLPEGHSPDRVSYRLLRNGEEWLAEDYIERTGDNFTLYLPDLGKDERVEVAIGWENAPLAWCKVQALLTTDQREKTSHWQGWALRK